LACHDGHFVGIEAKAGKGKTTALQEDNLQRIRDSGGSTLVINETNIHELETFLGAKNDKTDV
jgi:ABC-type cobalamin/Fe3+-siderophores transport system ATPase subunit